MLFKNWKWLFENTNQTPLSILNFEVKCVFYYLKLQINGHIVSYVNEIYIFWLRIFLLVFFPQRIIYIYIYTHTFLMLELDFHHSLPREIRQSTCSYFSLLLRTIIPFCAWNKCCRSHLNRSSSQPSRQLGQCLPGIFVFFLVLNDFQWEKSFR